jgi:hypothetical protein
VRFADRSIWRVRVLAEVAGGIHIRQLHLPAIERNVAELINVIGQPFDIFALVGALFLGEGGSGNKYQG